MTCHLTLTILQIALGAALTNDFRPISDLTRQVSEDGFCGRHGPLYRLHWRRLVDMDVAECRKGISGKPELRRGPKWEEFNDRYGPDAAERGLKGLQTREGFKGSNRGRAQKEPVSGRKPLTLSEIVEKARGRKKPTPPQERTRNSNVIGFPKIRGDK